MFRRVVGRPKCARAVSGTGGAGLVAAARERERGETCSAEIPARLVSGKLLEFKDIFQAVRLPEIVGLTENIYRGSSRWRGKEHIPSWPSS